MLWRQIFSWKALQRWVEGLKEIEKDEQNSPVINYMKSKGILPYLHLDPAESLKKGWYGKIKFLRSRVVWVSIIFLTFWIFLFLYLIYNLLIKGR